MSIKKYRTDLAHRQPDGSTRWSAAWLRGPTLSLVADCRVESLYGEPRVTAYVQGEPDSFFSIPAKFRYLGRTLNGYLTRDADGNIVCRHCYY